jgi:AraC family transcriptional regulator, ethanolamine operon transcriptional activator
MLDQLVSSNALQISRFPDFDHFRSIERLADAKSIPLEWKGFAASFAAVSLRSCTIYLQRTFPRILHVRYLTTGAIVGFSMADTVTLTMNGIEARPQALLLAKGDAVCEMVEPHANLVALVNFTAVGDRGWPGEPNSAQFIALRPAELAALRAVTRDILLLASSSPDLLAQPRVVDQLEESLLEAVDHAVRMSPVDAGRADLGTYLVLVRKLDEFLNDNAARTFYSADVAGQFGVPVRTLNNAVVAIRGMSMHRYIRLRRLWNVRQQLVQGASIEAMKAIALANGFWHMGEFRTLYRDLFGETPQQTLKGAHRQ